MCCFVNVCHDLFGVLGLERVWVLFRLLSVARACCSESVCVFLRVSLCMSLCVSEAQCEAQQCEASACIT